MEMKHYIMGGRDYYFKILGKEKGNIRENLFPFLTKNCDRILSRHFGGIFLC